MIRRKGFFYCEACVGFHRNISKITRTHKQLKRASERAVRKTMGRGF